jgi:DNA polymerase-1
MMGRYRHPAGIHSGNYRKVGRSLRQAGNAPIQGLAANIMQTVMIALRRDASWNAIGARMLMQVHDEILSMAPEDVAEEALYIQITHMEKSHKLITPVPLLASGGVAKVWCDIK